MMKYVFSVAAFFGTGAMALACGVCATPGPLLGAVTGPWGLALGVVGYGVYRLHKARG